MLVWDRINHINEFLIVACKFKGRVVGQYVTDVIIPMEYIPGYIPGYIPIDDSRIVLRFPSEKDSQLFLNCVDENVRELCGNYILFYQREYVATFNIVIKWDQIFYPYDVFNLELDFNDNGKWYPSIIFRGKPVSLKKTINNILTRKVSISRYTMDQYHTDPVIKYFIDRYFTADKWMIIVF